MSGPSQGGDWEERSLYSLARWKNGLAFKNIDFSARGMPVLKIAELKQGLSPQTGRTKATYGDEVRVRAGDMLYSWSGNPDTSLDVFVWEGEDGWLNQHIFKVTPAQDVRPRFLFFLLKWLRPSLAEIARNKQTSGLGHVTIGDMKELKVALPSIEDQDIILEVLNPVQDKSDLLQRSSRLLERVATLMFQRFIEGHGRAEAEATAEAGAERDQTRWRFGLPSDLIDFAPQDRTAGRNAPYIEMANLRENQAAHAPSRLRPVSSGSRFRDGDTLMARITPCLENGKTAIVDGLGDGVVGWGSTEFIIMRAKPGVPACLPYLLARFSPFRNHAISNMNGSSGRQRVASSDLDLFPIPIPPKNALKQFDAAITPLFERILANERELRTLTSLRDLLIPRLLSGKTRLESTERLLGAGPGGSAHGKRSRPGSRVAGRPGRAGHPSPSQGGHRSG